MTSPRRSTTSRRSRSRSREEQSQLLRKGMGELFVNLARRNQSLVQRQLELLDDLERNEHDPAALDSLFKLDHMATRMRRNAESLLVLSGAEQPRQWQQPIALIDVVRAAAAEIADFPRVELVGIDDGLAVSGRAVSDVAHLLAELLENATSFSPPDTPVVVSGAVSATGFVLAVSDQGIGITPERIAEANVLLAHPPVVGLALSRALGLHVVGSLAQRHGISVELRPGAPGGIVALVALPTAILEPRPAAAPIAPPSHNPVYSPDLDAQGAAEPLGARRLVSRPPDEPPVEQWGREGLVDDAATALVEPVAPVDDAPRPGTPPATTPGTTRRTSRRRSTCRPTRRLRTTPRHPSRPRTSRPHPPSTRRSTRPPPTTRPRRRRTTPPARSTRRIVRGPGRRVGVRPPDPRRRPTYDAPAFEAPAFDAPTFDAPAASPPPSSEQPPGQDEPAFDESAPLPTRVPGQHLSHRPKVANDTPDPEADPMRAYRVHELLTRHAQGKQRGQAGDDYTTGAPAAPGAPGVQEDGR